MEEQIYLEEEMKKSYLSYAMSVIVARAIPDVRDGFKPVHRRLLYAMHELGNTHDKPYKKSARIVGEVLGKYHPHGDAAIYDTLVRMAQPFSLRYPLVDGQGNFGSIDGDPPAAMRYTEVRMSRLSSELMKEIAEETVDFSPNFDNTLKEPVVLPTRVPQLLINGSSGIAVAMVSNIPPHNLGEVVDALVAIIDGKSEEEVLNYIKGPDFPTGGIVTNYEGLLEAYKKGKGKIHIMAKAEIDGNLIRIVEIPYQVSKTRIIEDIVAAVKSGHINGIADIHDRSDKRGLSLEIKVKKGYNPHTILNKLYKHTSLEVTYGIISIALVDGKPKLLSLMSLLEEFLKFRREVVRKRTAFRLKKAKEKAHLLEALIRALGDVEGTVEMIKSSRDAAEAKSRLMKAYSLDEKQAQAILDMRLQKLATLEREQIKKDHQETLRYIEELEEILASKEKVDSIIKEELIEIKEKYADERRTEIMKDFVSEEIEEEAIVVLTREGYIKRVHPSMLRGQHRGGTGMRITPHDMTLLSIINATTLNSILIFTNKGKVYSLRVSEIAPGDRYSKGVYLANYLKFEEGELPIAAYKFKDKGYILFLTKKGMTKRVASKSFAKIRSNGIKVMRFKEGDSLVDVSFADRGEEVFISTKRGKCIMFKQSDLRETSRGAMGVRGIKLSEGDEAVNISAITSDSILTITSKGYGRFTEIKDYRLQHRGGSGIINIKLKEGEKVVFSKSVSKESSLLISSVKGMVIKIDAKDVPTYGRNSRGVRLMRLKDDSVSAVTVVS